MLLLLLLVLFTRADTPVSQELLQVSGELQEDFQAFIQALQAAAAAAGAAADGEKADGSGNVVQQQQQQQQQQEVLQVVRSNPQEAFVMFCWAQAVVKHAAVQLQQQQQGKEDAPLLAVIPGLDYVPQVNMHLLMVLC
jgi:ABC-type transport system involved in cytochrome bd biosynthesis fused ATPase/permease subunit